MTKATSTLLAKSPSLENRFWAKVEKTTSCWMWTGAKYQNGYGYMSAPGTTIGAHRVSYEIHRGSIPADREIDHLCRTRACVNPGHMELVTHQQNMQRMQRMQDAWRSIRTHCGKGHELTEANVYVRPSRPGARDCRTCRAARRRSTP